MNALRTSAVLLGLIGSSLISIPASASSVPDIEERVLADQCSVSIERPHWSSGAPGVIFKARTVCRVTADVALYRALYRCVSNPGGGDPRNGNCDIAASEPSQSRRHEPNQVQTWYCPSADKPGVSGRGYYVGLVTARAEDGTRETFWTAALDHTQGRLG